DHVALFQLGADALGVPVLDAEADMADRCRHSVPGCRRGSRGAVAACGRARGGVASDDRAGDAADLHRRLRPVARTYIPADERLIERRAPPEIGNLERA